MGAVRGTSRVSGNRKHDRECLCWGLLFHMLGLPEEADTALRTVENRKGTPPGLKALASAVLEHMHARELEARRSGLQTIVKTTGVLLDPVECGGSGSKLSHECPRGRRNTVRNALDSAQEGYSRDPFKELAATLRPDVALAAILYVARAHALFFTHPKPLRDFNAAKMALNDLFQAAQLAARLYYSHPESHLRSKSLSQHAYLRSVRSAFRRKTNSQTPTTPPHASPFFIWWLLELTEIQRGNIYRQIEYLEKAEEHYRIARERFERLALNDLLSDALAIVQPRSPKADRWFITPTLILAFSERAKVQFDLGRLVQSISSDLTCLAFLVRRSLFRGDGHRGGAPTGANNLRVACSQALVFLRAVERQWVIRKDDITGLFRENHHSQTKLTPARLVAFLNRLSEPEKHLAADLFARLGFALYLLRPHRLGLGPSSGEDGPEEGTPADFFTVHRDLGVRRPALASYCALLLGRSQGNERLRHLGTEHDVTFPDMLERQLALRLREKLVTQPPGVELSLPRLCEALLDLSTQNIDNVVTIPRRMERFLMRMGYRERKTSGDASARTVAQSLERSLNPPGDGGDGRPRDKLVVLRRWQSFNPRIPRPVPGQVRGGGYLLLWHGKGFAIDPGYDFIQNLYEEGFSLDDIHAVVVTHSHPDHDDDLSTLTTLVREWNNLNQKLGKEQSIKLDLFLNDSTYLKFASWLKASTAGISRVVPMPLVVWEEKPERDPPRPSARSEVQERIRGGNVRLDLRKEYDLELEVVPAWHDDVIGRVSAVGLKFHLCSNDAAEVETPEPIGVVGYTGDTGAYGTVGKKCDLLIEESFNACDVLVANLGDIRLRELASRLDRPDYLGDRLDQLLTDWFCDADGKVPTEEKTTMARVGEFLRLLVSLNLASGNASRLKGGTVSSVLAEFIRGGTTDVYTADELERLLRAAADEAKNEPSVLKAITAHVMTASCTNHHRDKRPLEPWRIAYALLGYLCARAREHWRYDYHLGIEGIFRLHRAMQANSAERSRIFVVGELPEELASYRHHVARLLNMAKGNWDHGKRRVHALTGDIGLHIGLTDLKGVSWKPRVRCTYCNYNNESMLKGLSYHEPAHIQETCVKQLGAAMVYLCTTHDHHPENEDRPLDFLVSPSLRVV